VVAKTNSSQQSWQKGNTMYELIIDTELTTSTCFIQTWEEIDSIIQNLPRGSYWTVRDYDTQKVLAEGCEF